MRAARQKIFGLKSCGVGEATEKEQALNYTSRMSA